MFSALLKNFANQSSFSVAKSSLNLYFSVFIALFYNQTLWRLLTDLYLPNTLYNVFFLFSFLVLLTGCTNIIVSFFSFPKLHKPAMITILLSTALASYFIESYGVLIDETMIQNAVETNAGEVFDLININLMLHFILSGIIPALVIYFVRVRYQSFKKSVGYSSVTIVLTAFAIMIALGSFYKDYSMTFRENREIRYLATPTNYLYYSVRYLSGAYEKNSVEFTPIGQDAKLKASWQKRRKKVVSVIIVGETARAANFSLNGYHRNTNPALAAQEIINFSQASSCGTTTAVSVACMFSDKARVDFRDQYRLSRGNLLDVFKTAGFDVLWRDNNSGCKGVCDRVISESQLHFKGNQACTEQGCFDIAMLDKLDSFLEKEADKVVLIFHQLGSHGPAYSKRYPPAFAKFNPVCEKTNLSDCTKQELRNAYDNSILYTDFFISSVIDFFKDRQELYDASVLYLSDHGESLGEDNIYLHGLPYFMAPTEQTHIPMLFWMSKAFARSFKLDSGCLMQRAKKAVSQDNLFHSMLGLLDVDTENYQAELDLFSYCRQPS